MEHDLSQILGVPNERSGNVLERLRKSGFKYIGFVTHPRLDFYSNDRIELFYDPANDRIIPSSIKTIVCDKEEDKK